MIDPVTGFTKAALAEWAGRQRHSGTDVYSDELGAFRALEEPGHAPSVIEGSSRVRCEEANARWVNVVLGNLKRPLDGAYHAFAFFKYTHRYLAETAWRLNRRFDLAALPQWLRDVPVFSAEGSC